MKLELVKLVEPCERGLLSSVFLRLSGDLMRRFSGDLHLTDGTLAEIKAKTADPNDLIRRFGCAATLSFYEEDVLSALRKFSPDEKARSVLYEVCCQLAQLLARQKHARAVIDLVEEMIEDLPLVTFEGLPPTGKEITDKERRRIERCNTEARTRIRSFFIGPLVETVDWLLKERQDGEALRALRLLDQLGGLAPDHRRKFAELLWQAGERGAAALKVYLGYLGECGWETHLPEMAEFVSARMSIDEQMPREEVFERLPFNQIALCGKNPPSIASRHAGLGYLRLKEPRRALSYLRQAQSRDGADAGLSHFYFGQALFDLEEFGPAAGAFENAAALGFSPSRIASWQGVAYAKARQWEKALSTFRAAERDLDEIVDSEFYLQWGRASFLMKETEDAEHRFRIAVRHDQANSRAAYCLAVCLEQQGRRTEAIELLGAAAQSSEYAPAPHFMGRLLEAEGRAEEANEFFRRAVSINPSDIQYQLSLGLSLIDLGNSEGLTMLERVARAGAGGPEIVRRLALGFLREGDRLRSRYWLRKLAAESSASDTAALFNARDKVSEATEAFNAGRYRQAADLFEEAGGLLVYEPRIREQLALALAREAAERLARKETEGVWEQIERAHALASPAEIRFLLGFSLLVRGDARAAGDIFAELVAGQPGRGDYRFFNSLSAYFCGDETAIETLAGTDPVAGATNLNSLLAFLQVRLAAERGAFEEAGEKIKAWAEDQNAVRSLGLPARQINTLAALCMMRAAKQRKQRVVRVLETLNAQYGDNYWSLALTLSKHILAADGGIQHAASAEAERLKECDTEYQRLIEQSEMEDRKAIAGHYGRLLRFLACQRVSAGNIAGALEALDRLAELPIEMSQDVLSLRELLVERMREPSHEKAFALIESDPEAARAVWLKILAQGETDFVTLQHLACLAWTQAFDNVAAGRIDQSSPFWSEALEWYRRLFDNQEYWNHLREKGQLLGKMPGYAFNEEAFEKWRGEACYEMAHTLIELISFVMAGHDAADNKKKEQQVLAARSLMKVIRDSRLPA